MNSEMNDKLLKILENLKSDYFLCKIFDTLQKRNHWN